MASINDWAAKAAQRILDRLSITSDGGDSFGDAYVDTTAEEIAAIIATFAEPLEKLLRESKREHPSEDDFCAKYYNDELECDCGADEWNAKVDKVLDGQ